ncbi:hypothetical protein [Peribacillus butanolivorans]
MGIPIVPTANAIIRTTPNQKLNLRTIDFSFFFGDFGAFVG